ncbi:hypothetical protein EV360DRAFT_89211 [Lentinula raphanica]|nr:hypothetical protein EV360DRAFT_89211 [Lentinula raphanica]
MTKSSLDELDGMASLFEEAAPISQSAANILPGKSPNRFNPRTNNTNTHSSSSCSAAESSSSPSGSGSTNLSSNHSSPTSCTASFTNTAHLEETQSVPLSTFELDRLGGRTHLIAACNSSKGGSGSGTGSTRPSFSPSLEPPLIRIRSNIPSTPPYPRRTHINPNLHPKPPPKTSTHPTSTQNLHPTIAQDIRNIEMDVDMNFGGLESHFFDISNSDSTRQNPPRVPAGNLHPQHAPFNGDDPTANTGTFQLQYTPKQQQVLFD